MQNEPNAQIPGNVLYNLVPLIIKQRSVTAIKTTLPTQVFCGGDSEKPYE